MIQRATVTEVKVDYDTYRSIVQDGQKADLINGKIYMASPDTKLSNSLNGFLYRLIAEFIDSREIDGFVFISRFSCKISRFYAPEPDVGYVCPERAHLVEERHMLGGPDIAVEIVSRESRTRDYREKRDLYEAAKVTEYWIIDPLKSRAEFLVLKRGVYQSVPLERDCVFHSLVLPGFWLNVNWLLAPLPRAHRCLEQILSGLEKKTRKRKR